VCQLIITTNLLVDVYTALQQNVHRGEGSHVFNISGQNVNFVTGGPKNWHNSLYALFKFMKLRRM